MAALAGEASAALRPRSATDRAEAKCGSHRQDSYGLWKSASYTVNRRYIGSDVTPVIPMQHNYPFRCLVQGRLPKSEGCGKRDFNKTIHLSTGALARSRKYSG